MLLIKTMTSLLGETAVTYCQIVIRKSIRTINRFLGTSIITFIFIIIITSAHIRITVEMF